MTPLALETFLGLTPTPAKTSRPTARSRPAACLRPGAPLRCFELRLEELPAGLRVWAVDRAGALACGRELLADLRLRRRAARRADAARSRAA
jgi:hypothetical protein